MGILAFLAVVVALYALRRVAGAERSAAALRTELDRLQQRLVVLERRPSAPMASAAVSDVVPEAPLDVPVVPDEPAVRLEGDTLDGSQVEGSRVPASPLEGGPIVTGVPPEQVAEALPPLPEPAVTGPPVSLAHDVARQAGRESLEARIGSRWLLYLGVATLVLGVSYFIKYAFDSEWIAPSVRVLLGLAGGLGLIAAGQRFVTRGLERYGQALSGGGLGVLYLTLFAAHQWYDLIGQPIAFAAMVGTTALGAVLADRQRAQVLALFALVIGFFTPSLIGGDASTPLPLFTYLLVLVAGTAWLAHRRAWPTLNLASYVLTLLVLSAWGDRYYERRDYLVVELFLTAFLVLFLYVYRESRRSTSPLASLASIALALAPLFYHMASIGILTPHRGPFFVYLIAVSVAGVIASAHLRLPWLRLLVWAGVALPFVTYVTVRLSRGWLVAAWATLLAIYGVHLIAQAQVLDEDRTRVPAPEVLLLHGNGLWMLVAIWALLAPRHVEAAAPIAFGLAIFYAIIALVSRRWHAEVALHAIGLASGLTAVACAMYFSGPWLVVSLAAEGTVLAWLGLRVGRDWIRSGGLGLLALAVGLAALLLTASASLDAWPVLNTRTLACLFVVAALYRSAWLHRHHAATGAGPRAVVALLIVVANMLTVLIVSAEIDAYFDVRAWSDGRPGIAGETRAGLARQLSLSIAWAAYAVALIAAGLRWRYRPIRYLAIALLAITIGKVFFVDLARLDRVYRMLSVIGLGVLLLVASYLYQQLRAQADAGDDAAGLPSAAPDVPPANPAS